MQTFAERLQACLDATGTSQAELARQAKVQPASVSDWMRSVTAASNMKALPLVRAAAYLNVNPMWLLTGQGPRARSGPSLVVEEPPPHYRHGPFEAIDMQAVAALPRADLLRLEGAWLYAAASLSLSIRKQAAA